MAFLDSTTAVIDAILTRKGRELLAKNDGSFQITKFAFGDDEINYQLYDATKATNQDADILSLPVLEPISNSVLGCKLFNTVLNNCFLRTKESLLVL